MLLPEQPLAPPIPLRFGEDRVPEVLRRVGLVLQLPIDKSALNWGDIAHGTPAGTDIDVLLAAARHVGVFVKETKLQAHEIQSALVEGFPVLLTLTDGSWWVFEKLAGRRVEASHITEVAKPLQLRRHHLTQLLRSDGARTFVAKKELECDSLSSAAARTHAGQAMAAHGGSAHAAAHEHPQPLRRFLALLALDASDVWIVALFALVAGILALATPLAVESLVNVVSWGTYLQPLLILALMLLACLGMAGVLRVLQTVVVETIQRRQFVRIIGDLAHRFPRANQAALSAHYPRELANRVFDIVTIQKSTAILLLDGLTIVLSTFLGLLLLAFYHPYLLGYDIVLLATMLSITWLLGRGGVRTSIDESIVKYKVAHWLQDILAMPTAFKVNGGELLAIERANRLTTEYLTARERQFRVVIRQVAFAIGLQVVASTVLLGLGGWLVIRQQLTLGQLVASELVVTVVVGAFAKAGKSLEKFYDLMAGIDKVGHLLDIPVDARYELGAIPDGPAEVRWDELSFHFHDTASHYQVPKRTIGAGQTVAITGDDHSGKSLLLMSLGGLVKPNQGMIEIAGLEAVQAALGGEGRVVGYAGRTEIFHATLEENVDLGRRDVGQNRVREVLVQVGLWDTVLSLPQGLRTVLQTDGAPLSRTQRVRLTLARAMAGAPRLLLIDGLLDELTMEDLESVWGAVSAPHAPWTLLVATHHQQIADRCDQQVELSKHHG